MKNKKNILYERVISLVLVFALTFSFPIDVNALDFDNLSLEKLSFDTSFFTNFVDNSIGGGSKTIGSGNVSVVGNSVVYDSFLGTFTYTDAANTYELIIDIGGNITNFTPINNATNIDLYIPSKISDNSDPLNPISTTVTEVPGGYFSGTSTNPNTTIISLVVDDGITNINKDAFIYCSKLESIYIPGSVTYIGTYGFGYCWALDDVTLNEGLEIIDTHAFCHYRPSATYYNTKSTGTASTFTIPSTVTRIGSEAFHFNDNVKELIIKNANTTIEYRAFYYCLNLETLDLGDLTYSIGVEAFKDCIVLKSITIPSTVETIDNSAFQNCISATSLTIDDAYTSIGNEAFYNCEKLATATLGRTKTIGYSAFYNCDMSTITMPDTITSIGANAFGSCFNLKEMIFEGPVVKDNGDVYNFFNKSAGTGTGGGADGVNAGWTSILGKLYNYDDSDPSDINYGIATYGSADYKVDSGCNIMYPSTSPNNEGWAELVAEFSKDVPTGTLNQYPYFTFPHYFFTPPYEGGDIVFTLDLTDQSTKGPNHYTQNQIVSMPMTVTAVVREDYGSGITDSPVDSYVWTKDGVTISQAVERNYFPATDKIGVFEYYVTAYGTNSANIGLVGYSETAIIIVGPQNGSSGNISPSLYLSDKVYGTQLVDYIMQVHAYSFNTGETIEYAWYNVNDDTNPIYVTTTDNSYQLSNEGEYYCVVTITNSYTGKIETQTSNIIKIVVGGDTEQTQPQNNDSNSTEIIENTTNVTTPSVSSNLSTASITYELGETVQPLSVSAYGDGIISYQWYANDNAITGETDNSYTPNLIGTNEYYVEITNSPIIRSNTAKTVRSNTATITILDTSVKKPIFNTNLDPNPITYYQNDIASFLGVSASSSDGGTISYQWYKNASPLTNATSNAYMPSTAVVGTDTYYCIATNTKDGITSSETSNTVSVTVLSKTVVNIETPVITALFSDSTSYAINQDSSEIKVSVDPRINGDLSYIWYKSSNEDLSNTTIVDSGSLDQNSKIEFGISPSTSSIGITYYFCEVSNSYNGNTVTSRSNTAKIIVFEPSVDYDDNIEDDTTSDDTSSDTTSSDTSSDTTSSNTTSDTTSSNTSSDTTSSNTTSDTTSSNTTSDVTSSNTTSDVTSSNTSSDTTSSNTSSDTTSSNTTSDTTSSNTSSDTTSSNTTSDTTSSNTSSNTTSSNTSSSNTSSNTTSSNTSSDVTSSNTSSNTTSSNTSSNTTSSNTSSDTTSSNTSTYNPTSNISVASFGTTSISSSYLESYLNSGTSQFNVIGSNIQGINFAPTNESYNYKVNIYDSGTGLNYSWSIRDSSVTAYDLDLAIETAPSLSNVNQGITNINYSANSSQVIKFAHNGALNTNGATLYLTADSTLSDGTVWLYKLSNGNIILNEVVQGSVFNGQLQVSMQNCSDWVASTIRLVDVTSNNLSNTETLFYNIPTDARFNISQFQNIVVGTVLNLDNINTNFLESYRFEGWYYDTAYTKPVENTSALTVSNTIINSGIYPKMTYYNTSTPDVAFNVPTTNGFSLARLF